MMKLFKDDKAGFEGRVRRGATDLVNSMLNYAYSFLYNRVWQALLGEGLNPMDGVLHKRQAGKPTLVFDVVELFRAQRADRVVIGDVILDVIDIDENSLEILKILLEKIKIPKNFTIRFINQDFLLWENEYSYDLIIGNPPYGKINTDQIQASLYKTVFKNKKTNNIFSFFIEKAIKISRYISFIVPKSLLNAPEFNKTRETIENYNLITLTDYGEKAFRGVKIETISFLLDTCKKNKYKQIKIESYITNTVFYQNKDYIFSKEFPYWLIYRNSFFDFTTQKMKLDIFEIFRDRQITKKHTLGKGKFRVLKSRNIDNNNIKDIENYDCFIDNVDNFTVSKFLNQNEIVLVPNLTYYPRATFLPKNSVTDGSVAILKPKQGIRVTQKHLDYYSSKEFTE